MDNIKPWQIVIFVLAIGALGFSIWKFGVGSSIESNMAKSMTLVDVETGQLYIVDISGQRGVMIPVRRPETRELALMPVYQESGSWYLVGNYRGSLQAIEVEQKAYKDPGDAVTVLDNTPIKIQP